MIKDRSQLPDIFESHNILGKGAEIGVERGEYAKIILSKYLSHLYLIDIWETQDPKEYDDIANSNNHEFNLHTCINNLKEYELRYTIIKKKSLFAVNDFNDESLDFVYIDANHKYQYVKQDINAWFPKVRQGGIIAGHDYLNTDWNAIPETAPNGIDKHIYASDGTKLGSFGVNPAVDEFCSQNNYFLQKTTFEFLGSWYFIK